MFLAFLNSDPKLSKGWGPSLAMFLAFLISEPKLSKGWGPSLVPGSTDALFIELGDKIEGFSGLYIDEDGVLNIGLKSAGKISSEQENFIVRTVTHVLDLETVEMVSKNEQGVPNVRFVNHQYSFRELNAWKNYAHMLFGSGVTLVDADEYKNRVVIGIESEAVKDEVIKAYREQKLPIPEAAIEFAIIPVAELLADIRNQNRPVVGGLRIWSSAAGCTLGYNVSRFGIRGFVTNSHCSSNVGWPDGTVYSQTSSPIGYEVHDPSFDYSWWPWVCPTGFRCRESDSAFYRYYSGVPNIKHIAYVTSWPQWSTGSFTYVSTRNVLNNSFVTPVIGQTIYKVGATTGGTTGSVYGTCFSTAMGFSNRILKCQYSATTLSGSGDSGSPVFVRAGADVRAAGLLWGRDPIFGHMYFSAINRVMHELNLTIGDF